MRYLILLLCLLGAAAGAGQSVGQGFTPTGASSGVVDSTRLDTTGGVSVLRYWRDGVIVGEDTLQTTGGGGGVSVDQLADSTQSARDFAANKANPDSLTLSQRKGVSPYSLSENLSRLANSRPVVTHQAKAWQWHKHLQQYLRGIRDTLVIDFIGDSKTSDPETWQRPFYEHLAGAGLQSMSYGYVSFSFAEAAPWPTNMTRNISGSEIGVQDDSLVGADFTAVVWDANQVHTAYTRGTPNGLGEHPWDSIHIYYVEQPGGGSFDVSDSRGNSYGTVTTSGPVRKLASVGFAIRNGQDISPRVNIAHNSDGTTQMLGYRQWNTAVERGFILNKYGRSGSTWNVLLASSRESVFGIMEGTPPDAIAEPYGANYQTDAFGLARFRREVLEGTDLLRSYFPSASQVYVSTTYSINDNVNPDIFANYIDSLISSERLDASHINLNLAYYNSSETNELKGVTPDGTHYDGSVGGTNANFLWEVLFPTFSTNVGEARQEFWELQNGSTTDITTAGKISVQGIVNSSSDPAVSANNETLTSYGRATIGDINGGNEFGILTVMGYPGNGGEEATGFGFLGRKTLHLVQRGAAGDGNAQALIGFSGSSSGRPLAYFGTYQDGPDPEFVGFAWGTHSSGSAGANPYDAMRLTRLGQLVLPRMAAGTYDANNVYRILGISSLGATQSLIPSSLFGLVDSDADGNEVTNAADATSPTSLTTQQQVDAKIAALILSGSGIPEGAVTAPPGTLYLNTAGGTGNTLFVKETGTGNTGWVAK